MVEEWCSEKNQPNLETRCLCELGAAFQVNGERAIARRFEALLHSRATALGDGWLAALQLAYLSGDFVASQTYPASLDIEAVISRSDFSIAPNRATQFFSRLPEQRKSAFTKRMLNAFDGELEWRPTGFLIVWLLRYGSPVEMLKRAVAIEAWLRAHPDDTSVCNGYLGLLSKQGLDKAQLDRVITDTEAWLKAHPDDTHVRTGLLALLSQLPNWLAWKAQAELVQVAKDTGDWLLSHHNKTIRTSFYREPLGTESRRISLLRKAEKS